MSIICKEMKQRRVPLTLKPKTLKIPSLTTPTYSLLTSNEHQLLAKMNTINMLENKLFYMNTQGFDNSK